MRFHSLSISLALALAALGGAASAADGALHLAGRTELPGYTGDFDHFGTDLAGNRLFLAAEDHSTVEVFDLATGRHLKTVPGFEAPHNILYLSDHNRLIVIDSGAGLSKVLDGKSYKVLETLKLRPGADSMNYDPVAKRMYVVAGGKNGSMPTSYLYRIDPATGEADGQIDFDTEKVEAIAIERNGPHMYVNVTGKNQVAVIDKKTFKVVKTWPVTGADMPAPIALDESNRRLFVVTRKPFKLMVLDAADGRLIGTYDAPNRTNEIMFDRDTRRIYLAGDDVMNVYQQNDADHYTALEPVHTATGAKTAILIPERKRMFVAISSGEGKTGAAVLRYDVLPAQAAK